MMSEKLKYNFFSNVQLPYDKVVLVSTFQMTTDLMIFL